MARHIRYTICKINLTFDTVKDMNMGTENSKQASLFFVSGNIALSKVQ